MRCGVKFGRCRQARLVLSFPRHQTSPRRARHLWGNAMHVPRRSFLSLALGTAVLPAVSRVAAAQTHPAPPTAPPPPSQQAVRPLAERLADYADRLRYDDLDAATIERVKSHVVDTIGCGIAAFDEAPVRICREIALGARGRRRERHRHRPAHHARSRGLRQRRRVPLLRPQRRLHRRAFPVIRATTSRPVSRSPRPSGRAPPSSSRRSPSSTRSTAG